MDQDLAAGSVKQQVIQAVVPIEHGAEPLRPGGQVDVEADDTLLHPPKWP